MSTQQIAAPMESSAMIACREVADLAAILDPDVHIAIWRRPPDQRIVDLLERPGCTIGRHSRFVGHSAQLDPGRDLADLLPAAARAADPHGARALIDDVAGICEMFTELLCADELMVSLESPEEATCPRFHVDRVGVRMLVTYLGPGTELLANEHVDRSWLGHAGHGRSDARTGLMRPGAEIQQTAPFDVVLLKGEAWPGAEDFGAVHRSPDPRGRRRVILRVDMLSQRSFDHEVQR